MKYILRQAATLTFFLLLLYGLALAIASAVPAMRQPGTGGLDTASAANSPFMTEPKYAFLSRSRLDNADDKVILLGASNMLAGFRPARLQGLVPAATIHNLAIGGANITEVSQMVDLVLEAQGSAARRHNVFVIGVWYGLFADDRARWYTPDRHPGDTDLDIERYRYGFYRRTASGPVPLLPSQWLAGGVTLIKPFLLVDRLARDASKALRPARAVAAPAAPASVPGLARQREYLAFWDDYMGGSGRLGEAPFATLQQTVASILAAGGRVLLVDLPLPRWHAGGSPYQTSYRQHWQALQQRLDGTAGVSFFSLRDADQPEDFSDEVHPRPRVAERWAERLAGSLNQVPERLARR
ncbi:hypothetical protein ACLIKD_20985 [Azonexus sp. IMCC34842]|uniref:hypothetical protein n=1 Tax=Azonexus sp. IMCC34842 TaxID=3420950 RepID=UPI003D12B35F